MDTKNWYAWLNLLPPKPDDFHVIGDVFVGNPGVQAELFVREVKGIDPNVLLLDLHLVQRPGMWPQVMTWVQCRYDRTLSPAGPKYTDVEVLLNNASVAKIKVDEVH